MTDCFSLQSVNEYIEDLRAIEAYGEMFVSPYEAGNYADAIEQLLSRIGRDDAEYCALSCALTELDEKYDALEKENAKLKAERDDWRQKYLSSEVDATNLTGLLVQAVADLKISSDCDFCKYNTDDPVFCEKSPRGDECMGKRWEWRGVKE